MLGIGPISSLPLSDLPVSAEVVDISGSAAGSCTVEGSLKGAGGLAGVIAGTSNVTGSLIARGNISGQADGSSLVLGLLFGAANIEGLAEGSCIVIGDVSALGTLIGTTEGTCLVTGTLQQPPVTGGGAGPRHRYGRNLITEKRKRRVSEKELLMIMDAVMEAVG